MRKSALKTGLIIANPLLTVCIHVMESGRWIELAQLWNDQTHLPLE
jgi:hypothetical protein